MENFALFESALKATVAVARFCLETASVACIVFGLFRTLVLGLELSRRPQGQDFPFNQIRLRFGTWLALALEFQLGADILATTVAPTFEELGKLALIAVIRTFLNYFLSRELKLEEVSEPAKSPLTRPDNG
ncbi:DUF1622 domain-containing protein [Gloeobacter kilaueensis]|uniref:DUF1622 domain-containing protein n=1 Tax=Gloeobacter kilaueensis (strain ATCC BAA-2537 / CCAP 1431/1 / ULC 316 / JS1) TaxID=1183438 RepID=U5QNU7_GLOK1|nr:DUF1622 domain-containing protein [Gloeobacter kilaueensis]AGY59305.1 hypothetical protein GKIL_3059 [Gloeobacter kilaueensis JS1]